MTLPLELQAARVRLAKERPYLASAAWALQPVPKPGLGTMAVDMYWRLYYDPAVLSRWSVEVTEGALYHEICHLLRNHSERMRNFNPRLSNIAADAEINDDLIREGVKFPNQPVTPEFIGQPENLLAEEYYASLEKQEWPPSADQTKNHAHSDSPVEKETGEAANTSGRNFSKAKEGEYGGSDLPEPPRPGSGRCGSCATGQMAPWEDRPPSKGSSSGLSRTEGELMRRDVAKQIKEHARGQGCVPGHWARWAEEKLHSKVDWRKQLAAAVRFATADTIGATDYSYRRPSRRQGQGGNGGVIFPSMRCPVPSVAVVADTSGSISEKMLAQTLAELSSILKSLGQKEGIHVLAVDQTVEFCRRVFRPEQIQLAGGGGTDMGIGLETAARLKPLPQLGIVITDGHTSWPDRPPRGMKVIVVLFGDVTAPDWAKVIQISAQSEGAIIKAVRLIE
ncbi:VWA-like domain-containing protein [Desulfosporosinus nitroreducens]|uniref:VWA-like domain-containing protein n=1 Tax=Desulfosporosinus nitroreducens TaxID=2018668 RepID=A0ABT8QUV1_9FIRM|nr:VWA-like domain-containing protein [Desulfosporosinus nitroreducens]MDO0825131.1 VWA-like domain-containing protein [Desulfosporosinus nitroreducens]